ncbi:serine hydrolase domain-containing protein [Streptomyces sp. NPDC127114]|uniref:serine hydrolase domain-containing protein n=1 Tax=Streptomyces sp. NPDC127114 TaxID=3345366 RepID=UPI00362A7C43
MTSQAIIQDALDQAITEAGTSGNIVVLLVDKGRETLVERGTGHSHGSPSEQYYQLGSISKFVTAVACLVLDERGELSLDEPMRFAGHLIPRYLGRKVDLTPRQVLHHVTGLNVHSIPGYPRGEKVPGTAGIIAGEGRSPALAFTGIPTGRVSYSSGAFMLLQAELEQRHDLGELLPEAIRGISPGVAVLADSFEGPENPLLAQGFINAAIPVPHGSLHYPETCAGGLWARPRDLMTLLVDIAGHLRGDGGGGAVGARIRGELLSRRLHPKMAMSALVDEDREGRTYYHHQGAAAGFTTEFAGYPEEDVHVVAMASAAVTPPELRKVVRQALAASSVGTPVASTQSLLPADSATSADDHGEVTGNYAGDSLTAEVTADAATVRTQNGFALELRRTAARVYAVPGEQYPRLVIDGDRMRFSDGARLYRLGRSSTSRS